MTWPPQGGSPDPYQPDPHRQQQPDPYQPDPYRQQQPPSDTPPAYDPNAAYGSPTSGQPYSPNAGYPATTPYPPQYGYQAPYPPPPPTRGTNVMAILSLIFAFVLSPVGIVLGHIAKRQLRTSGEEGGGLATAGLVLSYIFTGLGALACCGWLAFVIFAASNTSTNY
jgi:hypothetical protein